jgi:Helix-turn-helix
MTQTGTNGRSDQLREPSPDPQLDAEHLHPPPGRQSKSPRRAYCKIWAKRLKMTQPAVARLESGEHNPTFPMLLRISEALGVELVIDISPTGHEPQLIGKRAQRNALESFEGNGCIVVVAAA